MNTKGRLITLFVIGFIVLNLISGGLPVSPVGASAQQTYNYNRSAAVTWASLNNYNDSLLHGESERRYCTTYIGRALNEGGLNTSRNWYGNQQIVQWMVENPDAWEERPLDQLIEGDFVLYSGDSTAPGNWSYVHPDFHWSLWWHAALVISSGRVAAWNTEQYNLSITAYADFPYTKGVHIRDNDPLAGNYQDQGTLIYGASQVRNPNGVEHRWVLNASSSHAPILFDVKPQSGNLTHRLILKNASGQVLVDTHSSSDGRGIVTLENVPTGSYYLHIIPDVGASGEYQVTAWATSIPRVDFSWGEQWSYSNIRRWQAYLGSATQSFYIKWLRSFGNLEITWELRTRGGTLLSSGSSVNGQAVASGSASGWVDFYITSVSGDGSYHVGIYHDTPSLPDVTMPTGNITSPSNNQFFWYDERVVHLNANATDNAGGSGVAEVSFWVRYAAPYAGEWRLVYLDTTYPYSVDWEIPAGLRSQLIEFGIHVKDHAGNYCVDPNTNPAGTPCGVSSAKRIITYSEGWNNPHAADNWIPKDWRFYLNQLSLHSNYNEAKKRCSGAASAMMLAMNGVISGDYNTMKSTANEIYDAVKNDARASVLSDYLRVHYPSVNVEYTPYYFYDDGWWKITTEIDAGHPLMLATPKMTESGHYIVIVGYRYDGSQKEVIAYDPFGVWQGVKGSNNYNANSTNPDSFKGQWVYYDFYKVWGQDSGWPWKRNDGYLITLKPKLTMGQSGFEPVQISRTDPDAISKEPIYLATYNGVVVTPDDHIVFLPVVTK